MKTRNKIILGVAVVAFVTSAVFWKQFSAFAQSVLDSFSDTSRVADEWNVTVDTTSGEVKLAEKTCDNAVWFCDLNSLCENSLGDGDFIIVKRTNETATQQWKTSNTDCDRPQCGQDGGQEGDNLVADNTIDFSDYPARDLCKDAGGRLPTLEELQCIYANRVSFGDNFLIENYWSGSEASTMLAEIVRFGSDGSTTSVNKINNRQIRCVFGW
jgi:hypothetical protein